MRAVAGLENAPDRRTHTVLIVDDEGWSSFDQVAAALKRRGVRVIRVMLSAPARFRRVLREPHLRWMADRLFYNEVIALGEAQGRRRLTELLSAGEIADTIVGEPTLFKIGVQSEHGRMLMANSLAFRSPLGARLLDKFEINEALAAGGVPVPLQLSGEWSPSEAVARLGLPLILKNPTGAAGYGVRIVRTLAELDPGRESLRGHLDQEPFYQQYIEGSVVMYAAVLGRGGEPLIEQGFRVERVNSQFGPSAALSLHPRKELIDVGRRVAALLQPEGFAEFDFVETPDGRLLHIDANLRAWGYIFAPLKLGVNYLDPYVALLRRQTWAPRAPSWAAAAGAFNVYPNALFEAVRSGSLGDIVGNAAELLTVCRAPLGSSYCLQALGQAALLGRRRLAAAWRQPSDHPDAVATRARWPARRAKV